MAVAAAWGSMPEEELERRREYMDRLWKSFTYQRPPVVRAPSAPSLLRLAASAPGTMARGAHPEKGGVQEEDAFFATMRELARKHRAFKTSSLHSWS